MTSKLRRLREATKGQQPVIHLRVVSPPDVTATLMPVLRTDPAVLNLTMLPGAVINPDGDAVHFDVLHGAANDVIGRLRDLDLEERGSIVLENGVVSLTEARTSTLIGVFISVTTIPAASDIGVSLAFGSNSEARGSALQLVLNVAVLAAVAIVGLPLQRSIWQRSARRALGSRRSGGAAAEIRKAVLGRTR